MGCPAHPCIIATRGYDFREERGAEAAVFDHFPKEQGAKRKMLLDASAGSCLAERRATNRAALARAKSSIPIMRGRSHEAVDGAVHVSGQY